MKMKTLLVSVAVMSFAACGDDDPGSRPPPSPPNPGPCDDIAGSYRLTSVSCDATAVSLANVTVTQQINGDCSTRTVAESDGCFTLYHANLGRAGTTLDLDYGQKACSTSCLGNCIPSADLGLAAMATLTITGTDVSIANPVTQAFVNANLTPCQPGETMSGTYAKGTSSCQPLAGTYNLTQFQCDGMGGSSNAATTNLSRECDVRTAFERGTDCIVREVGTYSTSGTTLTFNMDARACFENAAGACAGNCTAATGLAETIVYDYVSDSTGLDLSIQVDQTLINQGRTPCMLNDDFDIFMDRM